MKSGSVLAEKAFLHLEPDPLEDRDHPADPARRHIAGGPSLPFTGEDMAGLDELVVSDAGGDDLSHDGIVDRMHCRTNFVRGQFRHAISLPRVMHDPAEATSAARWSMFR